MLAIIVLQLLPHILCSCLASDHVSNRGRDSQLDSAHGLCVVELPVLVCAECLSVCLVAGVGLCFSVGELSGQLLKVLADHLPEALSYKIGLYGLRPILPIGAVKNRDESGELGRHCSVRTIKSANYYMIITTRTIRGHYALVWYCCRQCAEHYHLMQQWALCPSCTLCTATRSHSTTMPR